MCDHIARFWPVTAVIGEKGAFYFYHDGAKLRQRFVYDARDRETFRARLGTLREEILREVPGAAVASDQPYRESDLAIDFCEDVPALGWPAVLRIKAISVLSIIICKPRRVGACRSPRASSILWNCSAW